jgi:hypothetical protein
VLTHASFRGDDDHILVFCFAHRSHAVRFRDRFGGELIEPKSPTKVAREYSQTPWHSWNLAADL